MPMLMTPGPTAVPERVRTAMTRPLRNPDLSEEFRVFYHSLEEKLATVYGTDDDILILGGEAMLGLEASVASLIREGDSVLCLSNGKYGDGFADLVELYGGHPVTVSVPYGDPLDTDAVIERVIDAIETHDLRAATMVHCETPTGTLNDLSPTLSLLDDAGVITIVDAVSSVGGAPVPVADIDICIAGSPKCLSAPPGLTPLSVSDDAWAAIMAREAESFYTSLVPWKEQWLENDWFPHTHFESNLYALDAAVDMLLDEGRSVVFDRHETAAERCLERGHDLDLSVFASDPALSSPTVTAFRADGRATTIQSRMENEHDILIAPGLGEYTDDVIRIGHMGHGADLDKVERTMDALGRVVADLS